MPPTNEIAMHAEPSLYGSSQDQFLQNEDALSVAELIPLILLERKSFLNISEDLIEAEIAEKQRQNTDIDADPVILTSSCQTPLEAASTLVENREAAPEIEANTEDDNENVLERFQKQKLELLAHIGSALNETSLLLDFVSLLMSAEKPHITKMTMSPHLAKTAPSGLLSSDRLRRDSITPPKDTSFEGVSRKDTESIGMGWKYQSLTNVAGLFRDALAQLRDQVAVDKQYWGQISRVLAHGEVLFKLRDPATNSREIGVQYGYGDSGLTYHDRGHAILRKDPYTGEIAFCPVSSLVTPGDTKAVIWPRQKLTRVRILSKVDDDYMLTGQLAMSRVDIETVEYTSEPILNAIEKARFFLFEDDLFYHLIREAKNLINYNVTIIADKIIVDVRDQIMEIESIPYDEDSEEEMANACQNPNAESCTQSGKAQDVLKFLKLMLCCYYQYRLRLKQKMTTLFTRWKQANSHPLLLRPLLGHTRHQMNFRQMGHLLLKLCAHLDADKVSHTLSGQKYENLSVNPSLEKNKRIENPFEKAIQRPVSTFTLVVEKLASHLHLKIEAEVTTTEIFVDLVVKVNVSKYKCRSDLEQNVDGANVLQLEFTELADVAESLDWTLKKFLGEEDL